MYVHSVVQLSLLCQIIHNLLCRNSINEEKLTFITVCLARFNIVDGFGPFLEMIPLFAAIALLTICRTFVSFGQVFATAVVAVTYC